MHDPSKVVPAGEYIRIKDIQLEHSDFVNVDTDKLRIWYEQLKKGDPKQAELFGATIAKRIFSKPTSIQEFIGEWATHKELSLLIAKTYHSDALTGAIEKKCRDAAFKERILQDTALWSDTTGDPNTALLTASFFSALSQEHNIPYANSREVFRILYDGENGFDAMATDIQAALVLKSGSIDILWQFGDMWDTFQKEWGFGVIDKILSENTNMTSSQIEWRKSVANIALVGALIWQVGKWLFWKWFFGNEKIGTRWTLGILLWAQFASQAFTWKGAIDFAGKLLNGGVDEMNMLSFGKDSKKSTKEQMAIANAHQDVLPSIGGTMLTWWMFSWMTKSQMEPYITIKRNTEGKAIWYSLKDKAW
jgi:hypothetical protein